MSRFAEGSQKVKRKNRKKACNSSHFELGPLWPLVRILSHIPLITIRLSVKKVTFSVNHLMHMLQISNWHSSSCVPYFRARPLSQAGYIIDINLSENNSLSFISQVRLTLNDEMTRHQLNLIKHNKRLTFYSMFKTDCHKAEWSFWIQ